jgi:hypothetical protein
VGLQTNVIRRGAVYYYRVSVPADLMAIVRRREIWRSLGTSDPLLARRRAILAGLATHAWFDDLRKKPMSEHEEYERTQRRIAENCEKRAKAQQARAQVAHELADEELNAFVKQYYEREVASEETRRISERIHYDWQGKDILAADYLKSFTGGATIPEQIISALQRDGVQAADAIHYENCKEVEEFLEDRLRKGDWQAGEEVIEDFLEHTPIQLSENDYRRLAHRLGHAHLEVLRLQIAWFEGRWDYKPTNPFLLKALESPARQTGVTNLPSKPQAKKVTQRGKSPTEFAEKFLREKGEIHPKYQESCAIRSVCLKSGSGQKKL